MNVGEVSKFDGRILQMEASIFMINIGWQVYMEKFAALGLFQYFNPV